MDVESREGIVVVVVQARVTHRDFRNGFDGHQRVVITVGEYAQDVTFDGVAERSVDCRRCGDRLLVRRVDETVWQEQLVRRRRNGRSHLLKGFIGVSVAPPMCVSPSLGGDAFIPLAIAGGVIALFGLACLLMAVADFVRKPDRFSVSNQDRATKTTTREGVHTIHYVKAVR